MTTELRDNLSMMTPAPAAVPIDGNAWSLQAARIAQRRWRESTVRDRLRIVRRWRQRMAADAESLAAFADHPGRSLSEALLSEVVPLLDACRYLEKRACRLLKPTRHRRGRPLWFIGKALRVEREPHGLVLIVAPSNYKLMLGGIQTLQALVAGNGVILKPGRGALPVMRHFKQLAVAAGLPRGLLQVVDEQPEQVHRAMACGVDHVVFTGSNEAGRAVHQTAARFGIGATMELSGCDAAFVLDDADVTTAGAALAYGLGFNQGDTCASPRRLFVDAQIADALIDQLRQRLPTWSAHGLDDRQLEQARQHTDALERQGAMLVTKRPDAETWQPIVFDCGSETADMLDAPTSLPLLTIRRFNDEQAALREARSCPYALTASIFSRSRERALTFARGVKCGAVFINDMIIPIADPRLPFEAQGYSGFGVTRGPEGLLAMTRARAVSVDQRGGRLFWQYLPAAMGDWLADGVMVVHGAGWRARFGAMGRWVRGLRQMKGWFHER